MKALPNVLILMVVLLLVNGCARVQVSQDYQPGKDFSSYRLYQWKTVSLSDSKDVRVNNPLLHERFQRNIDHVLAMRGFAFGAPADFLVSYTYQIQTRLESDDYGPRFGFGVGSHYRYGEVGFGNGYGVRQYDVGVLVIDIFDIPSGALLWRGTGSEIVTTHTTPQESEAYAYRMVSAILAQFPPP